MPDFHGTEHRIDFNKAKRPGDSLWLFSLIKPGS